MDNSLKIWYDSFNSKNKPKKNISECFGQEILRQEFPGQVENPGYEVDISSINRPTEIEKVEEPKNNIKKMGLLKAIEMIDFSKSQLQRFAELEDNETNREEIEKLKSLIMRTMEYINGLIGNI